MAAKEEQSNMIVVVGNYKTMNLNPLLYTNIMTSRYFRVNLYALKTYGEIVDEIYYKVTHLEPWEKGSALTTKRFGMCGAVRGVGSDGIPSTAFCLLLKLNTMRLTKKSVYELLNHNDSPYIRALGFLYIRFTQPPNDLWNWYEKYLDDNEKLDIKAGGGLLLTIGEMLHNLLLNQHWFNTLFPRLPLRIVQNIELRMKARQCHATEYDKLPMPSQLSDGRPNSRRNSPSTSRDNLRPSRPDIAEDIVREKTRQERERMKKHVENWSEGKITKKRKKSKNCSSSSSERGHSSLKTHKHSRSRSDR